MAVTSAAADKIFAALYEHTMIKQMWELILQLMRIAKYSAWSHACDGASSNDRLLAYIFEQAQTAGSELFIDGVLLAACPCGNHRQHLVNLSILNVCGATLLNDVYAASAFLNSNGHFMRLLLAVDRVVQDKLDIFEDDDAEAVPGAEEYAERICDLLQWYCNFEDALSGRRRAKAAAKAMWKLETPN